jgi:hypothetical protein
MYDIFDMAEIINTNANILSYINPHPNINRINWKLLTLRSTMSNHPKIMHRYSPEERYVL